MKKIIDISQEVFNCNVFPGDPYPEKNNILAIKKGDICNLTRLSMCVHNGTHIDAPFHFIDGGKTVEQLGLDPFVGDCFVALHNGAVTADDAVTIMKKANKVDAAERILIAGDVTVTTEAAIVFANSKIKLLGNESQTIGPKDSPKEVHMILLGAEVVLLEGVVLTSITEGRYYLCAAPLSLGGCDGAPCRAFLIE